MSLRAAAPAGLVVVAVLAALVPFTPASALDPALTNALDAQALLAAKDRATYGLPNPRPHILGEDIATAIPIPGLPFFDTGNTCAYLQDYDEFCPFGGSLSPDVVYSYEATSDLFLDIRLCDSGYDTKLLVYENAWPNLHACNEDACGQDGFRSELTAVPLTSGNTYYIVVDGYGGYCGDYVLEVYDVVVEILPCPPGAFDEGEPECADGYDDQYNGGCNVLPEPVFLPLSGTPDGSAFSVCGTSGTYLFEGNQYRDTDWYELLVTQENTITFECSAEFPLQILLIDGSGGCTSPEVLAAATAASFPDVATFTQVCAPGTYWYWIGPSVFTDVPCGRNYATTIWGYTAGVVSTQAETWGSIKGRYRR